MTVHKTVLLGEAVESLKLKEGMTVVDATLGGGGHSLEILKKIGAGGRLIAFDRDTVAIERFQKKLKDLKIKTEVILINENFSKVKEKIAENGITEVDAILADFGLSSDQLDNADRGFSFQFDGPLDMRMGEKGITAADVVNNYSEDELKKIIREYGEENFAASIARRIIKDREVKRIETTKELVEVIAGAVSGKYRAGKIHFATRTFQALRIMVNKELESIEKFLIDSINILKKDGRLVVISFHSLEDRIVKNIFRENARGCICPKEFPVCRCGNIPRLEIITRKPIIPSEEEIEENARSRSAKMRVAEKK